MTDKQETSHAFARSRSNAGLDADTDLGFAMAFFAELSAAQEPLPPDFAKILYENLWDLYES